MKNEEPRKAAEYVIIRLAAESTERAGQARAVRPDAFSTAGCV